MESFLVRLESQLVEFKEYISLMDRVNPSVSQVPVGWHLEHCLKVIESVGMGLKNSDPADFKKAFSWKKAFVLGTGVIPRGKARAPKHVRPQGSCTPVFLEEKLIETREIINEIVSLPNNRFFEHPYFGHVTKEETPKFLVIHTEHHLKIIRDILK